MPVPQALDYRFSEIDALAAAVVVSLRVLRHTPGTDPRAVRERLIDFRDAVLSCVEEIMASREAES